MAATKVEASDMTIMPGASPFHEGEQRVQTRLGVRDQIEPWARQVVRGTLPEEHRLFQDRKSVV